MKARAATIIVVIRPIFNTSLSLALGLSDVIQSYSGGIVVDTMFIDEGFGSLDDVSRDQAIRVLNDCLLYTSDAADEL